MPRETHTKVWLGDIELTEHFKVVDVDRPYPIRNATVENASGRNGGVLTASSFQPLDITMRLVCSSGSREERRELIRWLLSVLDFEEPRQLQFSDDEDRYYLVVPTSGGEREATFRTDSIEVTLTALDPVMYGRSGSAGLQSPSATSAFVDGTAATYPTFKSYGYTYGAPISRLFEITIDDSVSMAFTFPDENAHSIEIDCENGTAILDGTTSIVPNIDSDWLYLTPGDHTVEITQGTASNPMEIKWATRWL